MKWLLAGSSVLRRAPVPCATGPCAPGAGAAGRRAWRPFATAALTAAMLSAPPPAAHAQEEGAAAALYDRGLAEMKDERYATACPALAESYRIDPRPGALFTLATCEARWGRLATAVARYDEYLGVFARLSAAEQARQRGRDKIALEEKAALAPQVPQLTLVLPASAPAGTIVTRDGVALGQASLGVALPVNPGEHTLTTQAPGGPVREQRIAIEKGEKKSIELSIDAAAAVSTAAVSAPSGQPVAAPSPLRTAGLVAGGVGIAGLIVGGVVGSLLFDKRATIMSHCSGLICDREGKEAADSARTIGLASEVGFGIGAVSLVGGLVLLLVAPSRPKSTGVTFRPLLITDAATSAALGAEGVF